MKKLITLLTLLLTVCSGAWAANETLSWTDMAISNHDANKAGAATSANLTPANGVVVNLETNGTVTKDFGSGSTTYYRYKGFGVDEDTDKYFEYSFSVASGYKFTPSKISVGWAPNGGKAVAFNVYAGTSSSSLVKIGTLIHSSDNTYSVDDLSSFTALGDNKDFTIIRLVPYGKASSIVLNSVAIQGSLVSTTSPAIIASDASISATISGVEVTKEIAVTGIYLTGSTLTATLNPAVEGLSVALGSDAISEGSISTTATISYTSTVNVPSASTTLTLSDGTTSKNVTITYSAKVATWALQTINAATTWDFSKLSGEGVQYSGDDLKIEHVYANIEEITAPESFDAKALAFTGEFPLRPTKKYAQNGTLHFKTSCPGNIIVKFSDTGTGASATAVKRYLVVNDVVTSYWASRENNSSDPNIAYAKQLDVTTGAIYVPAGDVTITGTSALIFSYLSFTPVENVPTTTVAVGNALYRTFASKYPLDFTEPVEGLTAYCAVISGDDVNFEEVNSPVPAGEGLLLKATEAKEYTIPVAADKPKDITNDFIGVIKETVVNGAGIFVLYKDDTHPLGFYKTTAESFTVGANTAYLPAVPTSARSFISIDNLATAIDAAMVENKGEKGEVYNLAGQRVAQPTKGLYILNGKKVIIK